MFLLETKDTVERDPKHSGINEPALEAEKDKGQNSKAGQKSPPQNTPEKIGTIERGDEHSEINEEYSEINETAPTDALKREAKHSRIQKTSVAQEDKGETQNKADQKSPPPQNKSRKIDSLKRKAEHSGIKNKSVAQEDKGETQDKGDQKSSQQNKCGKTEARPKRAKNFPLRYKKEKENDIPLKKKN